MYYCTIQNKLSNNIPSSLHLINETQILDENENFVSTFYLVDVRHPSIIHRKKNSSLVIARQMESVARDHQKGETEEKHFGVL